MSITSPAEWLQAETVWDGVHVQLHTRELTRDNARDLAAMLYKLAAQGSGPLLHLDCSRIEVLSDFACFRLVILARRLESAGERLILHNVRPAIWPALRAARLTEYVEVRTAAPAIA